MPEPFPADQQQGEPQPTPPPSFIIKLMEKIGAGSTGRTLVGGAAATFIMKSGQGVAAFLLSVLLARTLGADGYGSYAYAMSWIYLLILPALLGFDRFVLREIPVLEQQQSWAQLRGLLRFSHWTVLGLSFLLAVVGLVIARLYYHSGSPEVQMMAHVVTVAMLLLPAFALLRLRQNILLAKKKFILSQIGELVILPWGALLVIFIIVLMKPDGLTADTAINVHFAISVGAIVFLIVAARGQFTSLKSVQPDYEIKRWMAVSIPMLLVAGMQVLNQRVDILMVGSMLGAESAGIYAVANRGVMIILLIFFALNQPLAPVIAQLHAEHKTDRLQNILVRAARISLLAAVPIGVLLIIFATPFLRLFGEEFPVGREPMIIMTAAYVVVMGFGSVSSALTMTGHERAAAFGIGVSVIMNVVLNLILIPPYGMVGAAWALAIGQVSAMILMSVLVKWKLGVNTTATGRTL